MSDTFGAIDQALARIAELEASNIDYDRQLQDSQVRVSSCLRRIAELEAELERLNDVMATNHTVTAALARRTAIAEEREACAKIAFAHHNRNGVSILGVAGDIAAAIRARPAPEGGLK